MTEVMDTHGVPSGGVVSAKGLSVKNLTILPSSVSPPVQSLQPKMLLEMSVTNPQYFLASCKTISSLFPNWILFLCCFSFQILATMAFLIIHQGLNSHQNFKITECPLNTLTIVWILQQWFRAIEKDDFWLRNFADEKDTQRQLKFFRRISHC